VDLRATVDHKVTLVHAVLRDLLEIVDLKAPAENKEMKAMSANADLPAPRVTVVNPVLSKTAVFTPCLRTARLPSLARITTRPLAEEPPARLAMRSLHLTSLAKLDGRHLAAIFLLTRLHTLLIRRPFALRLSMSFA